MKTVKKTVFVFAVLLITALAASCATSGKYMALSNNETVIGNTQAVFLVRSSFFSLRSVKDNVNTQAYIHLLEEANKKFDGNIDIRDIEWVTGRSVGHDSTEISATGKVVRID